MEYHTDERKLSNYKPKDPRENDKSNYMNYQMEIVPWILYDKFTEKDFLQSEGKVSLFTKSFKDARFKSNVWEGQLPVPQFMSISGIMVILDPDVKEKERAEFGRNVIGELWLQQKLYSELPMSRVSSIANLDDLVKRNEEYLNRGNPENHITQTIFQIDPPFTIFTQSNFHYNFKFDNIRYKPKFIRGSILLDGYLARGVQ